MAEHHHDHDLHHNHHEEHLYQHSINHYSIQRGMIYKFLFASAMFATMFLIIAVLMPLHRYIKKLFSKIFNIKFNFKGMDLTIYSVIIIWIFFCAGLFACKIILIQSSKCKQPNLLRHLNTNSSPQKFISIRINVCLSLNYGCQQ